jgi:hypothetical protein
MKVKGRINVLPPGKSFGFLKVQGQTQGMYFNFKQVPREQQHLITRGRWAEFDTRPSDQGMQAINIRLLTDEEVNEADWACILVDEAGEWSSAVADKDRAIILTFLPSAETLSWVAEQAESVLRTSHTAEAGRGRTEHFDKMGEIVQRLINEHKAAFAVGCIPPTRWLQGKEMGPTLWAAAIAQLVAVYLPFVRERAWVAIEDMLVTSALWEFYRREVRVQFGAACSVLKRPDRAPMDPWWVRLCVYSKRQEALTHNEGQMTPRRGGNLELTNLWDPDPWDPDPDDTYFVPSEHIRWGLSLPDFVGNVMVSGGSDDAQRWRKKLQGKVREVDLAEFRL